MATWVDDKGSCRTLEGKPNPILVILFYKRGVDKRMKFLGCGRTDCPENIGGYAKGF